MRSTGAGRELQRTICPIIVSRAQAGPTARWGRLEPMHTVIHECELQVDCCVVAPRDSGFRCVEDLPQRKGCRAKVLHLRRMHNERVWSTAA
jgi:hypothetical protein